MKKIRTPGKLVVKRGLTYVICLALSAISILPFLEGCAGSSANPRGPGPQPPIGAMADFVPILDSIMPCVVAIDTEKKTVDLFNKPVIQEVAGSGWVLKPTAAPVIL